MNLKYQVFITHFLKLFNVDCINCKLKFLHKYLLISRTVSNIQNNKHIYLWYKNVMCVMQNWYANTIKVNCNCKRKVFRSGNDNYENTKYDALSYNSFKRRLMDCSLYVDKNINTYIKQNVGLPSNRFQTKAINF